MRSRRGVRDWRGVILVAAVYVYFLIFAQFAFLAILSANGIQAERLKGVMVSMAFGGILFSLLTPRIHIIGNPALRLRIGLCISVIAALLSLCPLQFASAVGVAFLIGTGLGIVTLTLVTHLAEWCGEHATHVKSGLGVGLGYLICNIPAVFAATPKLQALLSALVFVGVASLPLSVTPNGASIRVHSHAQRQPNFAFLSVLIAFTALIWLDSAAFYIIQHNGALKAGTWEGDVRLWSRSPLCLRSRVGALVAAPQDCTRADRRLCIPGCRMRVLGTSLLHRLGDAFLSGWSIPVLCRSGSLPLFALIRSKLE